MLGGGVLIGEHGDGGTLIPMTTTLDLPEDLMDEIRRHAAREGRNLDDAVTDLLRQALGGSAHLTADAAMLEARR